MNDTTSAVAERPKVGTVFAATLGHDLMALTLELLRTMPDHWLRMSEDQQKKAIERIRERVAGAVTETAQIVMRAQFPAVKAELESITISKGVKITLAMDPDAAGRHDVYDAKGCDVLIVLAESERWLERMDEIKAHADQLQLFEGDYDPRVDQPGYRRDQPPSAPGFMSWADLKKKLAEGEITKEQAEDAFGGPLPDKEPEPKRELAKIELRIDALLEILQGDGTWLEARAEQLKRGLVYRVDGAIFTCVTDPQPIVEYSDDAVLRVWFDAEPSEPLKFGQAAVLPLQGESPVESARKDLEGSAYLGALLERLYALRVTISLGTLQTFTPAQLKATDEWAQAYAADPATCKIARPLWLPIPESGNTNEEG